MEEEKIETSKTVEDQIIEEMVQIFSGKTRNIRKYEIDGEKKENETDNDFKNVYINPSYKDLYSAWEATFENAVEGYRPDETHVVEAMQQTWIVELPKVLMFNIGRVAFDKEQNMYSKNNEVFEFEDVIYPDRYLIKNRKEADLLRNQVNELRNKALLLQEHLDKFKNYYSKKHELSSVLHLCTHLFKSNMEGMESDPSKNGLQLFNPENLCKIADPNVTENRLNEMVLYLTTLQEKTNEQVDIMERQLTSLQKEIKDSYKSVDGTPYYLHSILIHDGNHESGHFYTFIKDFSKNKYRRYNDISVSEVDEERVMLESKGGFGTINAYCLVYVSEEIYKTCKAPNLHNYEHQFKQGHNTDIYNQFVNEDIAEKVYQENDNLLATIAEAEASEVAKAIMELYDSRIGKINKFMEENKESLNLEYASNICQFYHKNKKNNADYSNIGKWFLLDMCYKEITNSPEGLVSLCQEFPLYEKLRNAVTNTATHKHAPRSLVLTDDEQITLTTKMSDFPNNLKNALVTCGVLSNIVEANYLSAVQIIAKRKIENDNLFTNLVFIRDAGKVTLLRFTSLINQHIINGKSYEQDIVPVFHSLVFAFTKVYEDLTDNHYKQVCINLRTTYEIAKDKMQGYAEDFEKWVVLFEEERLSEVVLDNEFEPKYSPDLTERLEKINSEDYYSTWNDVYLDSNIGIHFQAFLGKNNILIFRSIQRGFLQMDYNPQRHMQESRFS